MNNFRIVIFNILMVFFLAGCGHVHEGTKQSDQQASLNALKEPKQMEFNHHFFEGMKQKHLNNPERAIKSFKESLDIFESSPIVHHQMAAIYKKEEKYNPALQHSKRAVELKGEKIWYLKQLAELYDEKNNYEEAVKVYNQIINLFPKDAETYYELAKLHLYKEELQKAIDTYDRLEKQVGINPKVINQKKRIYLKLNKVEQAANEIKKLIEKNPQNLEYHRMLAKIYTANDMNEKAVKTYEKILEIKPDDGKTLLAMARHHKRNGDDQKAFEYLKRAFGDPNLDVDDKVKTLLSNYLVGGFKQNNKEEAFALGEILVAKHPDEAKAHAVYGDFLYQDDQLKEARKQYRQATNLDKDVYQVWEQMLYIEWELEDFDAMKSESNEALTYFPNQPTLYLLNGIANVRLENYQEAVTKLESGLNLNISQEQSKVQFYLNLADAHDHLEQYEQSDSFFEKALEVKPNDPLILNNYSYNLALREEKLDKAEQMSQKSLSLKSENAAYLDTYGWIQYKKGNYQKAEKYVKKALNKSPDDPELLDHYGDVLFKLGKKQEAIKHWQEALDNGSESDLIKKKIRDKTVYEE